VSKRTILPIDRTPVYTKSNFDVGYYKKENNKTYLQHTADRYSTVFNGSRVFQKLKHN